MAELANGVPHEGEEVSDAQEGEQEAKLIKKSVKMESQVDGAEEEEEDAANKENVDDKTEDQVPDITNEDPMTTSMDGIEELANEGEVAKEEEGAEMNGGEVNGGEAEGEKQPEAGEETEKDVAEIPVNVYEEGETGEGEATAEGQEQPAEEEMKEVPIEVEEEAPAEAEKEAKPEEESAQQETEEAPQETEGESAQPEGGEAAQETEGENVEQEAGEVPQEGEGESAQQEGGGEEDAFELKAPPVPKRPRTPNELDEPQENGEVEQPAEAVEEPVAEAESEQPAMEEVPIEVEQMPSTPKSTGSRRGSGGSKLAADPPSVASPVPATPKSGGTTTPKSNLGGSAFDFDKPKKSSRRTTFEDEVLSVKSSKSRSPRSPRSPRTPKTPTKTEEPKPEEEVPPPVDEEEKQRQASFEARLKEREEEEARWKRMTSWDKGEDGVPKEVPVEVEEPIEEEEKAEGGGEEEPKVEETEGAEAPAENGEEEAPQEPAAVESEPEQPEEKAPEEGEQQENLEAPRASPVEGSPPPGPPRPERSPSPIQRREPSSRDYAPYDQDLKAETVPARMPADESFSSWTGVERDSYKPVSPWVDRTSKYRNEYTVGEPPAAPTAYTAFFDDLVSSGPFASSLYSTSRLLERSRSRTRERRQALRSQSQARNYFRFASQHPAPLRSRDYSTPPSSMISRAPTAGSSFVSFLDYAGAKQYEMARSQSLHRSPLYQSNLALSRSVSRGGIDYYIGQGRPSRVDNYVDSLHRPYEWNMPSTYDVYHASSRGQVGFAPLNHYQSYVDTLQRSLSRERYERDRLRNKYTTVSYQLEQACKQMDLLRSNNYSALRSGSAPRTSVYARFYPYY